MDDSSDSDDDARRGALLLADALSGGAVASERHPGVHRSSGVARPFVLGSATRLPLVRRGKAAAFGSAVLARCATSRSTRQGDSQPLLRRLF